MSIKGGGFKNLEEMIHFIFTAYKLYRIIGKN
jgi:hypothetical protein